MSLCPDYCEHSYCPHGIKLCETCPECCQAAAQRADQREHEKSVMRQRAKLKPMETPLR